MCLSRNTRSRLWASWRLLTTRRESITGGCLSICSAIDARKQSFASRSTQLGANCGPIWLDICLIQGLLRTPPMRPLRSRRGLHCVELEIDRDEQEPDSSSAKQAGCCKSRFLLKLQGRLHLGTQEFAFAGWFRRHDSYDLARRSATFYSH